MISNSSSSQFDEIQGQINDTIGALVPDENSYSEHEEPLRPPLFFVQENPEYLEDDIANIIDLDHLEEFQLPENVMNKSKDSENKYPNKSPQPPQNIIIDQDSYDDSALPDSRFFSLSSFGLTNVSQLPLFDDFVFSLSGKEYHCNKYFASFLSPVITNLLRADINASRIEFDIVDNDNQFENILSLAKGNVIPITDDNALFLSEIAKVLGNEEMLEFFSNHIPTINETNAIDIYLQRFQLHLDLSHEIKFIAYNFPKFSKESLYRLTPEQLSTIVSDNSLRIKDEDSFFVTLCDYLDVKGEESKFLLGYVNLSCLSPELMPIYLEMVMPEGMDGMIWTRICERLKLEVNTKENSIETEKDKLFNGILKRIRSKYKIHKMVKITASSFKKDNMYIVTDKNLDGYWSSYNLPNSWIKFDFKNRMIKLEEYSLETADLPPGSGHLVSWILEASNNDRDWTTLDSQYNFVLHTGNMAASSFPCSKIGFYRYFRLKQCGLNDQGQDTMILKAIEFFGRVKSIS